MGRNRDLILYCYTNPPGPWRDWPTHTQTAMEHLFRTRDRMNYHYYYYYYHTFVCVRRLCTCGISTRVWKTTNERALTTDRGGGRGVIVEITTIIHDVLLCFPSFFVAFPTDVKNENVPTDYTTVINRQLIPISSIQYMWGFVVKHVIFFEFIFLFHTRIQVLLQHSFRAQFESITISMRKRPTKCTFSYRLKNFSNAMLS